MADEFEKEADDEQTISLEDYLKTVEEQYMEADLVLGGDEGKECTYSQGYMKRQALFSCLTCTSDGNAGVCTACSLSCHEGHEIVELWTKRNFRCDCGNSKFGEFYCKLLASKDIENSENSYNHNFKGTYCTCDLPYPDPNVEEQVEMIQCCICEDWFHEEHLGHTPSDKIPRDEESEPVYEDLICERCAVVCSFLRSYPQTIFAEDQSNTSKNKAVVDNSQVISSGDLEKGNCSSASKTHPNIVIEAKTSSVSETTDSAGPSTKCILEGSIEDLATPDSNKPMFLSKNWRETLCRCDKCMELYARKKISYLLDKDESIAEYERMGKQRRNENIEKEEQNFLNSLGHVAKMELLIGIDDMKNEIVSYLNSSDPSKAITSEDILQVFENLAKKRKRNP